MKVILGLILSGVLCFAQEKGGSPETPAKYYRLEFTVKRVEDGKVTNTRSYTTSVIAARGSENGEIRARERFLEKGANGEDHGLNIGTNIDVRDVKELGNRLALYITSEISSAGLPITDGGLPVLRETKWGAYVLVPLKQRVTILSSDEPTSRGQMQMDLLATPLN